jgi:hypothetical protein
VLNQVRVALLFLVTTADDSKDVPTEEVRLRFLQFSNMLFSQVVLTASGFFPPSYLVFICLRT